MANEFKIKKGLIVTGASGGTVVDIQGSQGQLFSVTDDLSGSIFAVSDISGVPILDVNSSGLVTVDGPFTQTGGGATTLSGTLNVDGEVIIGSGEYLSWGTSGATAIEGSTVSDKMRFYTDSTLALTLDASQDAIFAGDVTVSGGDLNVGSSTTVNSVINMLGTTNSFIEKDTGNHLYFANNVGDKDIKFRVKDDTTNVIALTIDGSEGGNSTFAAQAFSAATSSGDVSSTLTTKGYVDSLITGATIYRGAWDPSGGGYGSPDLSGVTQTSGYYYICSAAGTAEPNGTGTEPDTWAVGDWVIYNDVSGTGQWQKIDNSSVLSGVGTGQTVALWEGAGSVTDSETLGNAPITVSGNNSTFAGNISSTGLSVDTTGLIQLGDISGAGEGAILQVDNTEGYTRVVGALSLAGGVIFENDVEIISNENAVDWFDVSDFSLSTADSIYLQSNLITLDRFDSGNGNLVATSWDASFNSVTSTTFLGDLNGTINTATTGTTQTAGNNSTLIATTAYADAAAAAIPIGNYLPLAGGTMTGTNGVVLPDNFILNIGTANDLTIKHNATNSFIENHTGDLSIVNYANDKDLVLWNDDGTGGIAKYLVLDGNTTHAYFSNPGNVGIGNTGPVNGKLVVTSGVDGPLNTVRIQHTRNDANAATKALEIDVNLSGADTTTADRTNSGLFVDLDSSANGDATHEQRLKGVNADVRFTGFTDSAISGYFYTESNYTGAKTAIIAGVYGTAVHDTSSIDGGVSNMYGVLGTSTIHDLGDVDNAFGGYFAVDIGTARGNANVGVTKGVEGHINIDKATTITYGEMMAVSGIIDNNEGTVPTFGNQYLFKGDYQGTKGGNAYGIYCEGDKHYFDGNVGIGTTSPGYKLDIESSTTPLHLNRTGGATALIGLDIAGVNRGLIGATTTAAFVSYSSAAAPLMTVLNTGNVGIGTTTPNAKLDIQGTQGQLFSVTDDLSGSIFAVSDISGVPIFDVNSSGLSTFAGDITFGDSHFIGDDASDNLLIQSSAGENIIIDSLDETLFRINGGTKMQIKSSGNVGIGHTSPTGKLDIFRTDTNYAVNRGDTLNRAGLVVKSSGAFDSKITFSSGAGSVQYIQALNNAATTGRDIVINPYGGNVGINTSTPGQKLTVDGRVLIQNSSTPFYIKVDSTYKSWVHHIASDDKYILAPSTTDGGETWDWANQTSFSASGVVTAKNFVLSSDKRNKTKIKDLTGDNVDISWKSFEMKGDQGEYRVGVIAQELEENHPEFVNTDDRGFKSVKYIDLLIAKIAELEARLEKLEK